MVITTPLTISNEYNNFSSERWKREDTIISRLARFWRFFWRFFSWLKDDAVLHSPLARIAPNSVSWAFAGHFNGIGCWKGKNTSISRLPQFCSLEQLLLADWHGFGGFLAVFRLAQRRRWSALTLGVSHH